GQDHMERGGEGRDAEQDVEVGGGDDDPVQDEDVELEPDVAGGRPGHQRGEIAQDQQQADRDQHGADDELDRASAFERLEQIGVHQPAEAEEDRRQDEGDDDRV